MISAIPVEVTQHLSELRFEIQSFSFVGGGCINSGGRLKTSQGDFFLKWNSARKFPGMFESEARGLNILRQPSVVHIPAVIATASLKDWQFIVLEFIAEKKKSSHYWKNLGQQLAMLHKQSAPTFGLDHDNYIGSLRQINHPQKNWIDFFIEQRLIVQIEWAINNSTMSASTAHQFDSLFKKLPELLPVEKPSLLHGDLWSGNLIADDRGEPCLIDPAVYYGHREAEIAFTSLFGGFASGFYESYNENFSLSPGFFERSDVYNLYPLMVHVNLFGGGYLTQVVSILRQFV